MPQSARPLSAPSYVRSVQIPRGPAYAKKTKKEAESLEPAAQKERNDWERLCVRPGKRKNQNIRRVALLQSIFLDRSPTLYFDYEGKVPPGRLIRGKSVPKMYYHHSGSVHSYNCVLNTLRRAGLFRCSLSSGKWCLLWGSHPKPESLRNYHPFQKTNHFPGSWNLGRKDLVWRHIARMRRVHGSAFNICPESFILPEDAKNFIEARQARPRAIWIYKPNLASCGRGIRLISSATCHDKLLKKSGVIQRYIGSPLLINGYKFDLRLYVAVTSIDPLKIWVFKEGLVRFATQKYSLKSSTLRNTTMHLTNYSVNKHADNYVKNMDSPTSPSPKRPSAPVGFPALSPSSKSTLPTNSSNSHAPVPAPLRLPLGPLSATHAPLYPPSPLFARSPFAHRGDSSSVDDGSSLLRASSSPSPLARRVSRTSAAYASSEGQFDSCQSAIGSPTRHPRAPLHVPLSSPPVLCHAHDYGATDAGGEDVSPCAPSRPMSPMSQMSPVSPTSQTCLDPLSDEYDNASDGSDEDVSFKWSLEELKDYFEDRGWDYTGLQKRIYDLVTKSMLAVEPTLVTSWHRGATFGTLNTATEGKEGDVPRMPNQNCCEMYGFDVLIDDKFRPWLLEVNVCPSLSSSSPLDKRIKTWLVADFLTLAGICPFDHKVVEKEMAEERQNRLLGLSPKQKNMSKRSLLRSGTQKTGDAFFGQLEQSLIADFVGEVFRRGDFHRVFPTLEAVDRYAPFFDATRYSNAVLSQWLKLGGEAVLQKGFMDCRAHALLAPLMPVWGAHQVKEAPSDEAAERREEA
eukprot:GEMP01009855.1.p1 GENE.GEMP01009855.1~~GEMP01009855.1.p1  ORF type:complete len:796 (+),score=165.26 GEMP01009855.1:463-2850(+)